MYFDYTYLIFVLPAVLLSLWASSAVNSRFAKFDKVRSRKGLTGAQAAQLLLRANGINDVQIRHISGKLTDNYNPTTKILSLSDSTFASSSIAAIGVAAHETGHAIQHHISYAPLVLRGTMVPVANIGSKFGPVLVMVGLGLGTFASSSSSLGQLMMIAGIILFSLSVAFYLVTLPVEFDASHRALKILQSSGTFDSSELDGAKSVLWAAAMTYVASALSAVGSLIRFILLANRRRR